MQAVLETTELFIRGTQDVRADEVAAYQIRNRSFMKSFEPIRGEDFYTTAHWAALLKKDLEEEALDRSRHFYLYPKSEPETLIGVIGLTGITRGPFQSCFMGYQMDEDWINRGLMTEAVSAVTRYAFDVMNLHRIEANVMPWNARSLRVLEKCGFRSEGLSRAYLYINGTWEDHQHMVLLNPQWKDEAAN